jgi:UDP-N-acetylmuramoyl-tripeptide--D-alanyl-D-alanine ligase
MRSFAALAVLVALLWSSTARAERCATTLTREHLDTALSLGTAFLLNNQQPAGNFHYAYDWRERSDVDDDSAVRQAGAAWVLALIQHDGRDVASALQRALTFFARHSRQRADGARYVVYPGTDRGSLGTVALVALAHIESLRQRPDAALRRQLDGYLKMLVAARRDDGGFHQSYSHDGEPFGAPSPYYDGEALLALVKTARYLGRSDLRPLVLAEADAGFRRHVRDALADDPDSDDTKGYYQWASMAYFELASWRHTADDAKHGDRLLALADWMVDVHRTLRRVRNTGYAYEGIIPAWEIARRRNDARAQKLAHKLDCVIGRGLAKLSGWQLGHPLANDSVAQASSDRRALGGVQNHAREPLLRIDVTQHQMHAVILARRFWLSD